MTSTALAFEAAVCCACGHRAADPFITAEDDLTGRPGRFTFQRCRACGLVYQTPRLTIERVKDYYDDDYLAHRQRSDWGWMSPFFHWALGSIDREKLRICSRYLALDTSSAVLDVGCGGGTFLARLRERHGAAGVGVDFVDLAARPALRDIEFHCGLFYDQDVGTRRFDLVARSAAPASRSTSAPRGPGSRPARSVVSTRARSIWPPVSGRRSCRSTSRSRPRSIRASDMTPGRAPCTSISRRP